MQHIQTFLLEFYDNDNVFAWALKGYSYIFIDGLFIYGSHDQVAQDISAEILTKGATKLTR